MQTIELYPLIISEQTITIVSKLPLLFIFLVSAVLSLWTTNGQAFNYACDSDTAGFFFVNGSQTDKWLIGTATHNSGFKGLYFPNNNGFRGEFSINNYCLKNKENI